MSLSHPSALEQKEALALWAALVAAGADDVLAEAVGAITVALRYAQELVVGT